jgi:hypothetical protein
MFHKVLAAPGSNRPGHAYFKQNSDEKKRDEDIGNFISNAVHKYSTGHKKLPLKTSP